MYGEFVMPGVKTRRWCKKDTIDFGLNISKRNRIKQKGAPAKLLDNHKLTKSVL